MYLAPIKGGLFGTCLATVNYQPNSIRQAQDVDEDVSRVEWHKRRQRTSTSVGRCNNENEIRSKAACL